MPTPEAARPPAAVAAAGASDALTLRSVVRAVVLAVLIGIPVSLLALGFVELVNLATHLIWEDVPDWLGMSGQPAWYLVLVPVLGALLVVLARRLPGHAAHGPLDGFLTHVDPVDLPGILAAAVATLVCGAVLGPEAPLLALGLGLGVLFARRSPAPVRQMASTAGGFAAFSALLGSPLVTALFLLEARSAAVASVTLLPGLAASGVGYLVFTGVGDLAGIDIPSFAVPGLPVYTTVRVADLLWAVPVAALAAVVVLSALVAGRQVAARAASRPLLVTVPLAGLVVGLLAVTWVAVSDQSYSLMMFSGEHAIPDLVTQTSAATVLLLLILKALGYAVSLGSGFRGGPIFPALFLGVAVGMFAALVLPRLDTTPAVACAVAAASAAATRLPFASAALSMIMVGTAGPATTVMTILGSVTGYLVMRAAVEAIERRRAPATGAT